MRKMLKGQALAHAEAHTRTARAVLRQLLEGTLTDDERERIDAEATRLDDAVAGISRLRRDQLGWRDTFAGQP